MDSILLLAALLPPLVLLVVMYKEDKVEKEPPRLLAIVFILGALCAFPAIILETLGSNILNSVLGGAPVYLYNFFMFFFVVGFSEEICKYFAARIPTWRSPEFNYTFDAILYCAVAALGFAAFENVGYVLGMGGMPVAIMRAVTAIPGHCIFGIYMGYYYGMAKFWALRGQKQRCLRAKILAIVMPMCIHGFYDYAASANSDTWVMIFFAFIIVLDIFAIRTVRKMSRMDMPLDVPGVRR